MKRRKTVHLGKLLYNLLTIIESSSAVDQLKVWLEKTPFKSSNATIKQETFYAVINAIMGLKPADLDTLVGEKGKLNDKLSATLSKYIFKAFELIANNDRKLLGIVQNGQHLLKVQLKIKEKMGNSCILKA